MPKTGTRKLLEHIQNELITNNIKMGRDALFDLLRSYGLLVKKTKRFHITTDSKHFFFKSPNLLKDLTLSHAEQVFVSDITYIKVDSGHAYLALVTDAYSKKIMGWKLDDNMRVTLVKDALDMAYKNCIHNHKISFITLTEEFSIAARISQNLLKTKGLYSAQPNNTIRMKTQ